MLKLPRRKFLHLAVLAAALPTVPRVAQAQAWPAKQIRAIIPVTPGSTIDIISRIVFEPLSRQLGHPIIMDNRPARAPRSARPRSLARSRTATRSW